MNWLILVIAGLFEIEWAIGLKYTEGFTRLWPTVGTALSMILSMEQPVTIFQGEGMNGPFLELYIACGRRHLKWLLPVIVEFDEKIFYVIEPARDINKILRPTFLPRGGWRSRQKINSAPT